MKKNISKTILLLLVFACWFSTSGFSQNHRPIGQGGVGSWRFLGEREIDFKAEKDFITVIGNDNIFRKLKFKILDAPVRMIDMKVVFANGEYQDVRLQYRMEKGQESRVIDLDGRVRKIKTVYFNYKTVGVLRGKAKLILFGQK